MDSDNLVIVQVYFRGEKSTHSGWKTIRILQGFAKVQIPRNSEEEPDFTVSSLKEIMTILS
ncbi:hypothetical protein FJZ31_20335 [Candidatus Poribacteria bacterium]|nr:hypothetical protein [Candidatus Poribacteria bacterium]